LKKGVVLRIVGIGTLHMFLYLWLVPFVIYPRFGNSGLKMTVAVSVVISLALIATIFVCKKNDNKNQKFKFRRYGWKK